ncbi:MAG: 3'-5' exonuclease [Bacteroidales bacterium]|jgi:ribonuclease D|nr:3'-5' exonuclease [Bacteroidales bacterium]
MLTDQTGSSPEDKRISETVQENRYLETVSGDELRDYDLSWFRGEIVVIDNIKAFRENFPRLLGSRILGFDTETRPSFKKGRKNKVSLIQLANENLACLFRINRIGLPEELADLLADPGVVKTGVAIHDDLKSLKNIRRFSPSGFIDLQGYVKDFGIKSAGLKKLSAIVLGFRISKQQQVTDWEAETLTEAQAVYAATDAWVCHQIYVKLNNDRPVGIRTEVKNL